MVFRCSDRTVLNAFHSNGVYFRPMYEKPEITNGDKLLRKEFAEEHGDRTAAQWNGYLHAAIDNKIFQSYTTERPVTLLPGGRFAVCIAHAVASHHRQHEAEWHI